MFEAQKKFETHPTLERTRVPHLDCYNEREHNFLESALLLTSQKGVARWATQDKTPAELSRNREMLMEHVGGMNILTRLVKERAQQERDRDILTLNWELVDRLIQVHDLAEILFGDKVLKTDLDKEEEDRAQQVIIDESEKRHMGDWVGETLDHYWSRTPSGAKNSREANFVKTIDEIEGVVQMFFARRLDKNKRGEQGHRDFFNTYTNQFPSLHQTANYLIDVSQQLKQDPEWAHHAGQSNFDFGTTQSFI